MTKEEAIDLLDNLIGMVEDNHNSNYDTALQMAIKALEPEPCDVFDEYCNYKYPSDVELTEPNTATSMPCEDAISRQALLDVFGFSEKTRKWGGDHSGYNTMMLYEIQDMIESAPSVNSQEPKTGHWIMIDEELQRYKCSECGEIIRVYDYNNETLKENYRFSHCGAKMESEEV